MLEIEEGRYEEDTRCRNVMAEEVTGRFYRDAGTKT